MVSTGVISIARSSGCSTMFERKRNFSGGTTIRSFVGFESKTCTIPNGLGGHVDVWTDSLRQLVGLPHEYDAGNVRAAVREVLGTSCEGGSDKAEAALYVSLVASAKGPGVTGRSIEEETGFRPLGLLVLQVEDDFPPPAGGIELANLVPNQSYLVVPHVTGQPPLPTRCSLPMRRPGLGCPALGCPCCCSYASCRRCTICGPRHCATCTGRSSTAGSPCPVCWQVECCCQPRRRLWGGAACCCTCASCRRCTLCDPRR